MNGTEQYDRPLAVADGIYWVGFHEEQTNFHCNPYLILAGDKAVLIDGGSRPDFAVVMMKVLQTGIAPDRIAALIYQHCDPDLCGSISNITEMIGSPDLKILAHSLDILFIKYYLEKEHHRLLTSIEGQDRSFDFQGRRLEFFDTPFAHNAGSFVTYDPRTRTLFSSDLFGSISREWELYLHLAPECYDCNGDTRCPLGRASCPLLDLDTFHRKIMPSGKALAYAMSVIAPLEIDLIAPQHGSLIADRRTIAFLQDRLANLDRVGIDAYL